MSERRTDLISPAISEDGQAHLEITEVYSAPSVEQLSKDLEKDANKAKLGRNVELGLGVLLVTTGGWLLAQGIERQNPELIQEGTFVTSIGSAFLVNGLIGASDRYIRAKTNIDLLRSKMAEMVNKNNSI